MNKLCFTALLVVSFILSPFARADSIDDLARDFWKWRAAEQPFSSDDIVRIDRPNDWVPNWSAAAIALYQRQLGEFEQRWKKLRDTNAPIPRQVDYFLMGSALSRVRWELDLTCSWQRNPMFYVDQTLGAYVHLLLDPSPFTPRRTRDLLATLQSIPATIDHAEKNLTQPVAPFARLAIDQLNQVGPDLHKSVEELKPLLDLPASQGIDKAAQEASSALEAYRDWLNAGLPRMPSSIAVGRQAYVFFLRNVALLPYSPEQILAMGKQEWARAVASENYEEHRNEQVPRLAMFKDQEEEIRHEQEGEASIRRYLEERNLLTIPSWVAHYRFVAMPSYLAPFSEVTEADDFTSAARLNQNSTRYIDPPSPALSYFALTTAKDPRAETVHEGIPGHYLQLALSWKNSDPIRRHYYDSSANEGLGFYAEEMMLHAGLFDDSPRSREIIWNFMRLRALRVEVDVKLALGEFSIAQAAEYLQRTVPMDVKTAHEEAAFFASTPGQAISYQIGKLQIYDFLASAQRQQGDAFRLREFHDYLWQNGNLPIVLQRWEYLGASEAPAHVASIP
jgi:uncharacterized protein (DUF885 family)